MATKKPSGKSPFGYTPSQSKPQATTVKAKKVPTVEGALAARNARLQRHKDAKATKVANGLAARTDRQAATKATKAAGASTGNTQTKAAAKQVQGMFGGKTMGLKPQTGPTKASAALTNQINKVGAKRSPAVPAIKQTNGTPGIGAKLNNITPYKNKKAK